MQEDQLTSVFETFRAMISAWDLLLIFLVWIGLHTVQERFPEPFVRPKMGWRLLPFLPMLICVPAMFVPGPWMTVEAGWLEKVAFGCLLGVLAYNFGGIAIRLGLVKMVNAMGIDWVVEKTLPKPKPDEQAQGSVLVDTLTGETEVTKPMKVPTIYKCKLCGCLWRLNPPTLVQPQGSWSLADSNQKSCGVCDNSPAFESVIEPVEASA